MKSKAFKEGHKRFRILSFLIFVGLLGVIVHVGWLQIIDYGEMSKELKDRFISDSISKSPRGKIVDRNGEILAVSLLGGSLYFDNVQMRGGIENDPRTLEELHKQIVEAVLPYVDVSEEQLYKLLAEKDSYYAWVQKSLAPEKASQLRKIIVEKKLLGVNVLPESQRYYPKENVAAQVLGFVGADDKGLGGIEYYFDDTLKGAEGRKQKINNLFDRNILDQTKGEISRNLPTIYLTLDSKIQYVLEAAMDEAVKKTKAQGAAALIMDPYTGEILGMVSRPTFNPNNYDAFPDINRSNKCISMCYEPGSVFKPIVGCMGLIEGLVTPNTIIKDEGRICIADRVIHNWDDEGRGQIPFSDVIKYSINTGMVQLGMELGAYQLTNYSKRFGFGAPTDIELSGEESGILYEAENMYKPDVATMSIGQGIAVTPLQMLRAICSIANGGELVQPYIVQKIVDADGNIIRQGKKKVVRKVMDARVATAMRGMMEQVVAGGGGKTAAIKGYRIAGKTGTAEKLAEEGGYASGEYIASFVGFVPADKPLYAMLVMLDTPKGMFYGSQVSAPVFRDTLQQILVAKGVQPTKEEGMLSFEGLDVSKKIPADKQKEVPQLLLLPEQKVKLPDFSGCDMRQTAGILRQGHLKLQPYGSGIAYKQEPAPDTVVAENSAIKVWFK